MALVGPARSGYTLGVNNPLVDPARSAVALGAALQPTRLHGLELSAHGAQAGRHGVLAVADDPGVATPWFEALQMEGLRAWALPAANVPPPAQRIEPAEPPLAVILHTLRQLRARDAALPLVVVCQQLRDLEHVLALEMGADDVIDAVTSPAVVAARLRALARRGSPGAAAVAGPDHIHFGALSLQLRERRVRMGGSDVALTEGEFEVLWLLATQAGQPVSRADLLRRLRGLPYQRIDRSIDCRVYRIRAKLGDVEGPAQRIRTVRNCGYLFSPAPW